jgi:hypothetical protein
MSKLGFAIAIFFAILQCTTASDYRQSTYQASAASKLPDLDVPRRERALFELENDLVKLREEVKSMKAPNKTAPIPKVAENPKWQSPNVDRANSEFERATVNDFDELNLKSSTESLEATSQRNSTQMSKLETEVAELKSTIKDLVSSVEQLDKKVVNDTDKIMNHQASDSESTLEKTTISQSEILDSNFASITEFQDKMSGKTDDTSQPSYQLVQDKAGDMKALLSEFKVIFPDKKIVDELTEKIDTLQQICPKLGVDIQQVFTLLLIFSQCTDTNGVFEHLKNMPHNTNMPEMQVRNVIGSGIGALGKFVSEYGKKLINDVISMTVKFPFDDKPTIPSYVAFGMLSTIEKLLLDNCGKVELNNKEFNRNFEDLIRLLKKATEDLKAMEKSDSTAPNIVVFLKGLRLYLQSSCVKFGTLFKDLTAGTLEISLRAKETAKSIKDLLVKKKDEGIFDHLSQ